MQTIRWTSLLALGMLAVPLASRAQTTPLPGPRPKLVDIATIPGLDVDELVKMPNGHVILMTAYADNDSYILAYDLTTKRTTQIMRGNHAGLDLSPQGDRIVYQRPAEGAQLGPYMPHHVWSVAINPATGAPAGPPQRVTTDGGNSPSLSPDGKLIAFVKLQKNPAGIPMSADLTVVPATGGTERVLGHYDQSAQATAWSADGKWVYIMLGPWIDSVRSIERVPATGGTSEHVISYLHPTHVTAMASERSAFSWIATPAGIRLRYRTANGGRGELDPSALPATFGPDKIRARSMPGDDGLEVLNTATGVIHQLAFAGVSARSTTWSPNQKQLALVTGNGDRQEIVVMDADGSNQRRFAFKGGSTAFNGYPSWAPDGKSLAYRADDGQEVRLLDVATGASRVIASAPAGSRFVLRGTWQPDGKAIRMIDATPQLVAPIKAPLVEFGLDGTKRVVRDLAAEFPSMATSTLASYRQALVTIEGPSAGPTQFLLVPLDGGAARTVPMPALGSDERLMFAEGISEKWFASRRINKDNQVVLQVMSTGTDSTRLLHLPPNVTVGALYFHPDGVNMLAFGITADKKIVLYELPLDGSKSRVIGPISRPTYVGLYTLSPDGKLFAYFHPGPTVSHIFDVDLTPLLQAVKKQ